MEHVIHYVLWRKDNCLRSLSGVISSLDLIEVTWLKCQVDLNIYEIHISLIQRDNLLSRLEIIVRETV